MLSILVSLLACPALELVQDPEPEPVAEPTPPPAPGYALHEWGLLQVGPDGVFARTSGWEPASAPPPLHVDCALGSALGSASFGNMSAGKPVVYIRPAPAWPADTPIHLEFTVADGRMAEVWPTPGAGPQPEHGPTWAVDVTLSDAPCDTTSLPGPDDPACAGLDLCEAAELASYADPVDRCLVANGVSTPALLYRGDPAAPQPMHLSGDTLTVGPHTVGPLWVVTPAGLVRHDHVEPGATVTGGTPEPDLLASLHDALLARGLTEAEAGDFAAAWAPDVLAEPWPWVALGLLSDEGTAALLPLTAEPAPAELVRVHAVAVQPPREATLADMVMTDCDTPSTAVNPLAPPEPEPVHGHMSHRFLGGEPSEEVQRIFVRHQRQLQSCYEQQLREHPDLEGRLEIRLWVEAGRVTQDEVGSNDTGNANLEYCTTGTMRQLIFPDATTEEVTVLLEFSTE